jgi:hypothetical protein
MLPALGEEEDVPAKEGAAIAAAAGKDDAASAEASADALR